uniref:Uncharacterized protein n=2 Tax=unclassified Caudoviricetes TaxID=2788787 RepID=A0A8S5PHG2_9CAUD|nr:MAG TPA: hypothetical protein [Siphoviridae sp. ctJcm18]DAE06631.1 MAG TPA: hypothetical protein [Siphoviridae sp. ctUGQ45]DAV73490.1 MAG TPA: hypothetical protein [Bacteriophage sp.]
MCYNTHRVKRPVTSQLCVLCFSLLIAQGNQLTLLHSNKC